MQAPNARPIPRRAIMVVAAAVAISSACGGGSDLAPTVTVRNEAACTDFYEYANVDWIAATPVPEAGADSISLESDSDERNQRALLQALSATPSLRAVPKHAPLLALYASYQARAVVEAAGLAPLQPDFALIDSVGSMADLPAVSGELLRRGVLLPLRWTIEAFDEREIDEADSGIDADRLVVSFEITPPFIRSTGIRPADRSAFEAHVARTFVLLGYSDAAAAVEASDVSRMEIRLDELSRLSSPTATAAAAFDVPAMLAAAGVPPTLQREVEGAATQAMSMLAAEFDVVQWRSFLRWRVVTSFNAMLPERFVAERDGWSKPAGEPVNAGFKVDPALAFLSRVLPRQLDRFFADKLLPAGLPADAVAIDGALRLAMHRRIDTRSWMSDATRLRSHRNVDTLETAFVGLVEDTQVAEPAAPFMQAGALLANVRAAAGFEFDRRMALALASRTSRSAFGDAWFRNEPYYNRLSHRLVIHAVAAQNLYGVEAGVAGRFGSLGGVVAHEMLHAFGNPGDLGFDPDQPISWLDEADRPGFAELVTRLQANYAEYVQQIWQVAAPTPRFMGEDLSDSGAIRLALDALQHTHPDAAIGGLFAGWAHAQRTRQAPADELEYVSTVPAHAIYRYRVNAPLSNMSDFASTYACREGDAMVAGPPQRLEIW